MKTAEELKVLKEEVETLNKKLAELTDEELEQVAGGTDNRYYDCPKCYNKSLVLDHNDSIRGRDYFYCWHCGRKLTYVWEGARWIEGWE